MGIVSFLICGLAAYLLDTPDTQTMFNVAVVNAGFNFWSFGVMSNYQGEPMMVSNFWTVTNMLTTLIGIGLLILSFFL